MIQLTTNLSEPLLALLREEPAIVDGLEIGPWLSPDGLRAQRGSLPEMPFYFHGGNLLLQVGMPGVVRRACSYVQLSGSPWASFHLFIWPYWMARIMYRYAIHLPRPNPERETRRLLWQVRKLQQALPVPLALENVEFVPFPDYADHARPALIRRVLEESGCDLLLDLGHVRVASAALGMDERDYLTQLPLERVVQVHVSGPRIKNGRLFDAHEPLRDEDYALLEFTLQHTRPRVLTLEYIREKSALREQLLRLREISSQQI